MERSGRLSPRMSAVAASQWWGCGWSLCSVLHFLAWVSVTFIIRKAIKLSLKRVTSHKDNTSRPQTDEGNGDSAQLSLLRRARLLCAGSGQFVREAQLPRQLTPCWQPHLPTDRLQEATPHQLLKGQQSQSTGAPAHKRPGHGNTVPTRRAGRGGNHFGVTPSQQLVRLWLSFWEGDSCDAEAGRSSH